MPSRTRKKRYVEADVWTLGQQRMDTIYEKFDHVSVMFSGGKDSTACLHVALEAAKRHDRLPLDVIFFDEEVLPPPTIEYVYRVSLMPEVSFRWLCVPIHGNNACSPTTPFWYPWNPPDKHLWVRPLPTEREGVPMADKVAPYHPGVVHPTLGPGFNHHQHAESNAFLFPDLTKRTAVILGLRTQESLRRHRAVAQKVADNFISKDKNTHHVWLCKPIYDWTTDDVWTAHRKYEWDYNRTYDVLAKVGLAPHNQRVCPPYPQEGLGTLWIYAECWPEMWDAMVKRVPGANAAAMYGGTPIYATNNILQPAEGETWETLIRRAIDKWPPEVRSAIAARIQDEVRRHFTKTRDPIPHSGSHPISGVSWSYLCYIAIKGDLKSRHLAVDRLTTAKKKKAAIR